MANDLISREAALEAARAGLKNFVGIQWTPETRHYVPKVVHGVRDALQKVPAIDAVPVIRCKDCKNIREVEGRQMCVMRFFYPKDDDYCSCGERRGDHGQ